MLWNGRPIPFPLDWFVGAVVGLVLFVAASFAILSSIWAYYRLRHIFTVLFSPKDYLARQKR